MTDSTTDAAEDPARAKDRRRAAKILYRPVGIISSIIGGLIAARVFRLVYKHLVPGPEDQAPKPLESSYKAREVVLGALIQGAVFSGVRALINRAGARAFERWTGEWPGD
ncbi:DUF4235 domain-containing protein [Luteimicrobium sp. NPDC057192]|uniref:DUF4235 domain-containing protein n=1 Tax=Luteimicrobium sp. NPDC057192 TaxID=3346042 RepID=UPI00363F2B47